MLKDYFYILKFIIYYILFFCFIETVSCIQNFICQVIAHVEHLRKNPQSIRKKAAFRALERTLIHSKYHPILKTSAKCKRYTFQVIYYMYGLRTLGFAGTTLLARCSIF